MPENKEPELTCESKEAIRGYLLRLFTLPAIAVSVLSFILGLAIREGATGRALAEATKDVLPQITSATKAASDASASAERAKLSTEKILSDAEQTATKAAAANELAAYAGASAERAKLSAEKILTDAEETAGKLKRLGELQSALQKTETLVTELADTLSKDASFKQQIITAALKDASSFVRYEDKLALECEQHPGLHLHAGSGRNVTVEVNALSSPFVRWKVQRVPAK